MKKNSHDDAVLALLARVRRLNKRNGVTLANLAERTDMQANNISRMLQGRNNMRLDKFLLLITAAGLEISFKKIRNK